MNNVFRRNIIFDHTIYLSIYIYIQIASHTCILVLIHTKKRFGRDLEERERERGEGSLSTIVLVLNWTERFGYNFGIILEVLYSPFVDLRVMAIRHQFT